MIEEISIGIWAKSGYPAPKRNPLLASRAPQALATQPGVLIGSAAFDADQATETFTDGFAEFSGFTKQWLETKPKLRAVLDTMLRHRLKGEGELFVAWRDEVASGGSGQKTKRFVLKDGREIELRFVTLDGGCRMDVVDVSDPVLLRRELVAMRKDARAADENKALGMASFVRVAPFPIMIVEGASRNIILSPKLHRLFYMSAETESSRGPKFGSLKKVEDLAQRTDLAEVVKFIEKMPLTAVGKWQSAPSIWRLVTEGLSVEYLMMARMVGNDIVVSFHDQTSREQIVEAREQACLSLERVRSETQEQVVALNRQFQRIVSHFSYSVRSPITSMIGFTELLAHVLPKPLTDKQQEFIGQIAEAARQGLSVVEDLQAMVLGPASSLHRTHWLVSEAVRAGIAAAKAGNRCVIDEDSDDVAINADKALISRMFKHLFDVATREAPDEKIRIQTRGSDDSVQIATTMRLNEPQALIEERRRALQSHLSGEGASDQLGPHYSEISLEIVRKVLIAHGGQASVAPTREGIEIVLALPYGDRREGGSIESQPARGTMRRRA